MKSEGLSRRSFLKGTGATIGSLALASTLGMSARGAKEKLSVITWGAGFLEGYKKAGEIFTEETGIPVQFSTHTGGSVACLSKIRAAWPNSPYDVVSGWQPSWKVIANEGWYVPLTEKEVPNIKELTGGGVYKDPKTGDIMAVNTDTANVEWFYLTDKLDEKRPLTSIEQLILEPRFRNEVMVSSVIEGTGLQLLTFALQRGGDEYNIDPGFEFAKELAKARSIGSIYDSEAQFLAPMTRGEFKVSFGYSMHLNTISKKRDISPLLYLGDNKVFFFADGATVIDTPMKDAAKKFINILISAEVNDYYCKKIGAAAMNKNAEGAPGIDRFVLSTEEEVEKFGYFPDYDHIMDVYDEWNKRWQEEVLPLI